jgi:NhaP-type Na+/H+ or K+/H+ antiporter
VIVTGPTVVNPLLRRIRVDRKVSTVLEAEGIFGDAVGAIVAVVALEVLIAPSRDSFAQGVGDLLARFGIGTVVGLAAGLLMAGLLRVEGLVPEGLENVFSLTLVLLTFQLSNGLSHESGIVAVIVAGLVVGNVQHEPGRKSVGRKSRQGARTRVQARSRALEVAGDGRNPSRKSNPASACKRPKDSIFPSHYGIDNYAS